MLKQILNRVQTAVADACCSLCGGPVVDSGYSTCRLCHQRLGFRLNSAPLPPVLPSTQPSAINCHAVTLFNNRIRQLIYSYKFHHQRSHQPALVDLLFRYLCQWQPDWMPLATPGGKVWLVTIPPHEAHGPPALMQPIAVSLAQRLQTWLSASAAREPGGTSLFRPAGQGLFQAGESTLLCWQRSVQRQHHLHTRQERLENMRDSLLCEPSAHFSPDDTVLLLDDLMTTGATLNAAAQAIRQSGFKGAMAALVLCHVPMNHSR
ncbi:MAG: hypothetical protein SFZ03_00725 [Candidatus Melainabacteria bacterium]|nr:hypothetical protein [Candidatus Melainabacteria bacterium]